MAANDAPTRYDAITSYNLPSPGTQLRMWAAALALVPNALTGISVDDWEAAGAPDVLAAPQSGAAGDKGVEVARLRTATQTPGEPLAADGQVAAGGAGKQPAAPLTPQQKQQQKKKKNKKQLKKKLKMQGGVAAGLRTATQTPNEAPAAGGKVAASPAGGVGDQPPAPHTPVKRHRTSAGPSADGVPKPRKNIQQKSQQQGKHLRFDDDDAGLRGVWLPFDD